MTGEKKKVLKTYRSKTTLDDLAHSNIGAQAEQIAPRTKKRRLNSDGLAQNRRASSRDQVEESLVFSSSSTSDALTTTHKNAQPYTVGHDSTLSNPNSAHSLTEKQSTKKKPCRKSPSCETSSSLSWASTEDRIRAQDHSITARVSTNTHVSSVPRHEHEVPYASASSQSSMLPPPAKTTVSTQPEYYRSEADTNLSAPVGLARPSDTTIGNYLDNATVSRDRMGTPAVLIKAASGQDEHLVISDTHGKTEEDSASKGANYMTSSLTNDEIARNNPPPANPDPNERDYRVKSSYVNIMKKAINDQDELSLPQGNPAEISEPTPASKIPSKGKLIEDDESSSDSASVGLPKEQYQPRPSRSRSNRAVDDLILPTDYSKRPETLLKGKRNAKRSKTIGDDAVGLEASKELITSEVTQKIPLLDNTKIAGSKIQGIASSSHLTVEVPAHTLPAPRQEMEDKYASESIEPKKKRGRPKKQTLTDIEDNIAEINTSEPVLLITSIPDDEEPEIPLPTKKSRKRKDTKEEPLPASTKSTTEEIPPQNHTKGRRPAGHDTKAAVLADVPSKTNIIKQPVAQDPLPFNASKETSPAPSLQVSCQVQTTPLKQQGNKGPDKHSPLNSGKVRHRVGLSKKANIAPLLKMVKK